MRRKLAVLVLAGGLVLALAAPAAGATKRVKVTPKSGPAYTIEVPFRGGQPAPVVRPAR